MAERQVALVPTMIQLENFPVLRRRGGGASSPPTRRTCAPCTPAGYAVFGAALEAGVPDLRRHRRRRLPAARPDRAARSGRWRGSARRSTRSGAGSWRARAWLGRPDGLAEGAPADLVVFDADPRADLACSRHPRHVVLRGRLVG